MQVIYLENYKELAENTINNSDIEEVPDYLSIKALYDEAEEIKLHILELISDNSERWLSAAGSDVRGLVSELWESYQAKTKRAETLSELYFKACKSD